MSVPEARIRACNQETVRPEGNFVLYWMIANRRANWNFSLERAVEHALELGKPLLILEALRTGYRWASDRLHNFVIQGMADNAAQFESTPASYYPYLEFEDGDGRGLIEALAEDACVVVTDDFPCFFLPRMIAATADRLPVLLEAVDSNGLLPMRITDRVFTRAHDFRRHLHKTLKPHLEEFPQEDPLDGIELPQLEELPEKLRERWPRADVEQYASNSDTLSDFAIDHSVAVTSTTGGSKTAANVLQTFLTEKLPLYGEKRNQPELDVSSGLSPYLHFGHISAHDIFRQVTASDDWSLDSIAEKPTGSRSGWWGCSETVESFLDELITWREVGFNMCALDDNYESFDSLPGWAQETLAEHADDERPSVYSLEEFEEAATHDELWNAAQNQLVREGKIHNYLRMLWGKKILHWTESPQDALQVMIELNNKYALDGRNPNSYSGIFWVLGRYDRAWGPERDIFGKIRYMTSDSTAKKLKVKNYIREYSG